MARFSALTSDSSDGEGDRDRDQHKNSTHNELKMSGDGEEEEVGSGEVTEGEEEEEGEEMEEEGEEEGEEEEEEIPSSGISSSDLEEEDFIRQAPKGRQPTRNALFEDDNGGIRYAQELHQARSSGEVPVIPWAHQLGVDAQKMRVMQASLFRMPEEEAALKALLEPPRTRSFKPRKLNRKHSRDSDGDGLRFDSRERTSFAMDVEPPMYRPSRKYARVDSLDSAVTGNEGALADAGLSMGRSYRVGWGPNGTLVHLGEICGPMATSKRTANSSVIHKTRIPVFPNADEDEILRLSKLLQHHLSNSPILPDDDGIPFANPSNTLCFASFTSLFSVTDQSPEALLYRLGHALFDKQDLRLGKTVTIDTRNQINTTRRKAALSAWLEDAISSTVDFELKNVSSKKPTAVAFTLLTGHQIEKASETLMNANYVKLASLACQASGDLEFRADLDEQLRIWREQRVDVFIDEAVRKIYALLAGKIDILEGSQGIEPEGWLDITSGLGWKQLFGVHLWYMEPADAPISQAFRSYEKLRKANPSRVAAPLPAYFQTSTPILWKSSETIPDILYSLIRLHSDPACSLSNVLLPFSFGPSPIDYSMCWHLYILLSRCMRVRDFSDRQDLGVALGEDGGVEGHSPTADLLASMYAFQLEQLGLIQEAIFVLLHIEGSAGRMKAVKDLLSRSAPRIEEWMLRGILGSLQIPMAWINEAKAIHLLGNGDFFQAFELFYSAKLYESAHEIAVTELAPDAVIRQDFELLKKLFTRLGQNAISISGWHVRGQVFLDYANVMTRLPQLQENLVEADASEAVELDLEDPVRTIPVLLSLLPEALRDHANESHIAALAEMTSRLAQTLDKLSPKTIISVSHTTEPTKLRRLHSATRQGFLKRIELI